MRESVIGLVEIINKRQGVTNTSVTLDWCILMLRTMPGPQDLREIVAQKENTIAGLETVIESLHVEADKLGEHIESLQGNRRIYTCSRCDNNAEAAWVMCAKCVDDRNVVKDVPSTINKLKNELKAERDQVEYLQGERDKFMAIEDERDKLRKDLIDRDASYNKSLETSEDEIVRLRKVVVDLSPAGVKTRGDQTFVQRRPEPYVPNAIECVTEDCQDRTDCHLCCDFTKPRFSMKPVATKGDDNG